MKIKLNEVEHLAKGAFQHRVLDDLIRFGEASFQDNITTRKYYSKYIYSFTSLFDRLKQYGIPVELILGKHGGYWTSKIILKK